MLLSIEERRVVFEISTQVAGEEAGLHVWDEPPRDFELQHPMLHLLLLAALARRDDGPASGLGTLHGATRCVLEMLRRELAPVYEGDGQASSSTSSKARASFFVLTTMSACGSPSASSATAVHVRGGSRRH